MDVQFYDEEYRFKMRTSALIIEDNKLLLTKNDMDPMYYTPGGKVEIGEEAAETVVRELFEETGVEYKIDRLLFIEELFYEADFSNRFSKAHEITFHYLMKPTGILEFNNQSYTHHNLLEHFEWIDLDKVKDQYIYPRMIEKLNFNELPDHVQHLVNYDTYQGK